MDTKAARRRLHGGVPGLEATTKKDCPAPATLTPDAYCTQSSNLRKVTSTSIRIDTATHRALKMLAADLGTTVGKTVALAVRRFRQDQIGRQLAPPLTTAEVERLDGGVERRAAM